MVWTILSLKQPCGPNAALTGPPSLPPERRDTRPAHRVMNMTPMVFGPQWQATVQPVRAS